MMFDNDNLNLSVENISKLTNANFISIAYTIQKIKKILIQKENACIIGFGSVSGFLGRDINATLRRCQKSTRVIF